MTISIFTSGSRGDVQPYVALGKGLQAAGFEVCVLASDEFEGLVTGAGLAFRSTGLSIEELLQSEEWRGMLESGNMLAVLGGMRGELKRRAADLAHRLPPLLDGTDLMITGMAGQLGAFSAAAMLNIPVIQAYVFPFAPTRAYPAPLIPKLPVESGALNRLSYTLFRQAFWQTQKSADVTTRRELGMPRGSFWGPFRELERQRTPVLYGYSRHVLPHPYDWGAHQHVTGYWFLDSGEDWMPPADLTAFLEAGSAPVYVGFGSMGNRNPEETAQLVVEALEHSGQRGVIASGWGGLTAADLPDTVHMIRSVPHTWLFPQMAAVVHHGGAGTTAAGLRAGVPSLVVPFMGDQPFWGQRVADLGVGPAPIPRKRLTVDRLAAAITEAVSDAAMQQRAADLGDRIRAEDGAAEAAALVKRLMENGA